ncbi:hypothetical protein [Caudoviricetes sp.]|nr:hypothetical protein [Caudoviricetes sp.]
MCPKIEQGSQDDFFNLVLSKKPHTAHKKEKRHRVGKPKKDGYTEAQLLADCKEYLRSQKLWFARIEGGGKIVSTALGKQLVPSENVGLPDLIILKDGKFFAAELKISGGYLSTKQKNILDLINLNGGKAEVVTSVDDLARLLYT